MKPWPFRWRCSLFYWVARRHTLPQMPGYLLIAAVALTHHLTSYILAALLFLWSLIFIIRRRGQTTTQCNPFMPALVLLVASVSWTMTFGQAAISYLGASFHSNGLQLFYFLVGAKRGAPSFHRLFRGRPWPVGSAPSRLASVALLTLCGPIRLLANLATPPRQ